MTHPANCMVGWKALANPPTCLFSTPFHQLRNPLRSGGAPGHCDLARCQMYAMGAGGQQRWQAGVRHPMYNAMRLADQAACVIHIVMVGRLLLGSGTWTDFLEITAVP